MTRVDFHTHVVVDLPDFAALHDDPRWPSFTIDDSGVGRLSRNGKVVRDLAPSAWSVAERLRDMDAANIDVQVLSPIPPIICDWPEAELASEWTRHINRRIASLVSEAPDRFVGLGTVPLQHPSAAVAVLEDARRLGLAGVEIGTTAGDRELDDPELRAFFAAAERLDMLVFVHPLILGASCDWTDRISGIETTFGLGMTTDTAIAASHLVFGGVTEEFPALRVCLSHGGGTFFWAFTRIAHLWDAQNGRRSAHDLIANLYADTVLYEPRNVGHLCSTIGADHVVFGTDYPLPAQDDIAGGALRELGPDAEALVAGRNAERLLNRFLARQSP